MLTTPLLAHGITHLTDARYFAAWHPDYLCFPLGEGGLSLDYFLAIREWVEGPVCVAELGGDAGTVHTAEELHTSGITHVMLDYGTDPTSFREAGIQVLTRMPVAGYQSALDIADQLNEVSGPILLDFTAGGITWSDLTDGHPFSPGMLKEMTGDRQIFLRIDLTPDEAHAATETVYGLALSGSSEEKVGYKSFDDLDDLLEALEEEI
ncbi:phosphoribosylanthranilate isomerase [Lewinella aquimaris]|uniref:Phosphoribosylanthranilate isomerase n=1 Tax=Neolewinella aquimaris TaxID=1835722 RepID=A0A840EB05_9BACT|nr:hypothetical protein [Neolewinella aquimaris]MBB4080892.1 phosphoribosylanthranilate isomerase [Neolewinella aquimaris]